MIHKNAPHSTAMSTQESRLRYLAGLVGITVITTFFAILPSNPNSTRAANKATLAKEEVPSLWVRSEDGQEIRLGALSDTASKFKSFGLWLRDANGKPRAMFQTSKNGFAQLELFDSVGHTRLGTYVLSGGDSELFLVDAKRRTHIGIKSTQSASSVVIARPVSDATISIEANDSSWSALSVQPTNTDPTAIMGSLGDHPFEGFHVFNGTPKDLRAGLSNTGGSTGMFLWKSAQLPLAVIDTSESGASRLSLKSQHTKAGLAAGITSSGNAGFLVTKHDGTTVRPTEKPNP